MTKAKMMNALIKKKIDSLIEPNNQIRQANFEGFLEAAKIILTNEQIEISFKEAKRFLTNN